MYPVDNYGQIKRGYTHGVKTFYSNYHLGVDLIVPVGTPIYAPFDGVAKRVKGTDGGNMVYFYADGLVFRFLHLSSYGSTGSVLEGTLIGYSGNTGKSTAPHIHLDISPEPFSLSPVQRFLDPDKFQWFKQEGEEEMWKEKYDELHERYNNRIPELKRERDKLKKDLKEMTGKFKERSERVVELKRERDELLKKLKE